MSSDVHGGAGPARAGLIDPAPGAAPEVPARLRALEPLACLALAGHAVAVTTVVSHRWELPLQIAALVLLALGTAGLLGARSTRAVVVRGLTVLGLGFALQAVRADTSGYFLLWYFVLVSVYPLVLPRKVAAGVPVATPLAYLCLVPLDAADGPWGIAVLRALSLALIGVFVYAAAEAYRAAAADQDATRAVLDTFVAAAPVGLAYWDADGRFARVNSAFAEVSGRPQAEHLGRYGSQVPGFPEVLVKAVQRVLRDGRPIFDLDVDLGDREWSAALYPVRSSWGITGVGAVLIEVTVDRATARQLARSEANATAALTTLQTALLPAEVTSRSGVEVTARYRAAGRQDQVGGDWYDTITLPTGGLALVIGDVEGHDLTAASVMGLVRGAVRSYALEGHPPSIVLRRVSEFLHSAGIERLVTMAYVQLYPGDSVATVALAGHPAPIVVPHDGAPPSVLELDGGPMLGVEATSCWEERTVLLPREASLVLHTDGVSAATGDDTGLVLQLAADAAAGGADAIADALISAAPGHDDAAVLVARLSAGRAPSLRRSFPAQPISAGIARTWLADLFAVWTASGRLDGEGAGVDRQETGQLLLTELVSNAVRHSDESVVVGVRLDGDRLRVDVTDTSERMPVMRRPEAAATEGRGLRLVHVLASDWGVDLVERGKSVWFELDLSGRADDVDVDDLLSVFDDTPAPDEQDA